MKKTGLLFIFVILQYCSLSQNSETTSTEKGVFTDDRDGRQYHWVKIGPQVWMSENINIGVMIKAKKDQTNNGIIEKYCYNNDSVKCIFFGGLYQYDEMSQYDNKEGIKGICPQGWHVPTKSEWLALFISLGSETIAGGKLKSTSSEWFSPNQGATNSSGFSALPSGWRTMKKKDTDAFGIFTVFRSSSEGFSENPWVVVLDCDVEKVDSDNLTKEAGFSVRCIKDQ